MHIGFLNSWPLDPALGSGSAVAITGLAAGLEALGHQVTHVTGGDGRGTAHRLRYNLSVPRRTRRQSFDLLVGFDLDGFLVEDTGGTPYAVALKGVLADEMRFERGLTRFHLRFLATLERHNARRAAVILVTSRYSRDVAVQRYGLSPHVMRVVPEGIDLSAWKDCSGDARQNPSLPLTILSVGRQYPRKNTATLLEAFARVLRGFPQTRLRIVGGGPEIPRLQAQVARLRLEGTVRLLGELPTADELRAEYERAHIFCLPSLQEGFGIVFLEAMAAGLPVVASDVAAVPEVVPDKEAGYLVDPGDPDAVAAALVRLLGNANLRRRIGDLGRVHVQRYDWSRVSRQFLREALSNPGRARGLDEYEGEPAPN